MNFHVSYDVDHVGIYEIDKNRLAITATVTFSNDETYLLYLAFDKPEAKVSNRPQQQSEESTVEENKPQEWRVLSLAKNTKSDNITLANDTICFDNSIKECYGVDLTYDDIQKNKHRFVKLFLENKKSEDSQQLCDIDCRSLQGILRIEENKEIFSRIEKSYDHGYGYSNPDVRLNSYDKNIRITIKKPDNSSSTYTVIDFKERPDPEKICNNIQKAGDCIYSQGVEDGKRKAKDELLNWLRIPEAHIIS